MRCEAPSNEAPVELDSGVICLWGLHNFYPGCFPNAFFKRLVLFCKMIIVFGCIPCAGSVFPAPWSGFLVYSYLSDTPIPARLSRYQSLSLIYYRWNQNRWWTNTWQRSYRDQLPLFTAGTLANINTHQTSDTLNGCLRRLYDHFLFIIQDGGAKTCTIDAIVAYLDKPRW